MDTTNVQQTHQRVLILDEPSQLKTLTALLEEEGFCVLACSRAAEALDALAQGGVAVAIVDPRLPDLGTGDLLSALVAWSDRVPVIIHTAFPSYDSARDALNVGAFAYAEKAGNPEELVRHVHRAFQSRLRRYAEQLKQAVESRTRELQEANTALRESEERFRSLFATSLDAVLLTMSDGRILAANEAACRIFGRSEEELIRLGRSGVVDASDPHLAPALEERARTSR